MALKLCVLEDNNYKHGDVRLFLVVSYKCDVNASRSAVISSAEN